MTLKIYFLRHGQTELSRDDLFCGSGLDPELTPDGLQMAQAFAETFRSVSWRTIYSSSLRRGLASAEPIADATGCQVEVRPELNEIAYGDWEGKTKDKVAKLYPQDYRNWLADPARHAPTQGELATTVAQRALTVIEEINKRYDHGNVLVVSHKATIRILLCSLLGISVGLFRYRLACPVSSISVVEFLTNGPMLLKLGDRSHLDESLRSLPGT
jgi:broad specificity phosphatase PhoE